MSREDKVLSCSSPAMREKIQELKRAEEWLQTSLEEQELKEIIYLEGCAMRLIDNFMAHVRSNPKATSVSIYPDEKTSSEVALFTQRAMKEVYPNIEVSILSADKILQYTFYKFDNFRKKINEFTS